ncbi:MAG: HAMP domain-containing sensor histidine kinase [Ethanoligenens sp.]
MKQDAEKAAMMQEICQLRARLQEAQKISAPPDMELLSQSFHELRAPLARMLGYVETLQDEENQPEYTDKVKGYLKRMRGQVLTMSRLVDELFHRFYLETDEAYTFQAIDTAKVFAHYAEELCMYVEAGRRIFSCDIVTRLPPVRLDADRFAQVLHNLVENAMRYTQRNGHISIRVDTFANSLRVRVSDDGSGIPSEARMHVFDSFYSLAPSGGRRGTGLGLGIARTIVEAHGGSIHLVDDVDVGAVFEILIPFIG